MITITRLVLKTLATRGGKDLVGGIAEMTQTSQLKTLPETPPNNVSFTSLKSVQNQLLQPSSKQPLFHSTPTHQVINAQLLQL